MEKIQRNQSKDEEHLSTLKAEGWKVITVWECELKPTKIEETLAKLAQQLREISAGQ